MNKVNVNKVVDYANLLKENEKLHSIIKEVREYIEETDNFDVEIFDESTGGCLGTDLSREAKHILEILDKVEGE